MGEQGNLHDSDSGPSSGKAPPATDSERYLQRLCERSFLRFWSYSRIFQDSGLNAMKIGKELCDLLVVFGDDVIIFSDKQCEFPQHRDVIVAWKRWYKRAVGEGAKQIAGAERRIREFPDRLFLDPRCSQRFPIPIPNIANAHIHRIVVAKGAAEACRSFFNGGSGSLVQRSDVMGSAQPFVLGRIASGRGFVHVFDDVTLDVILKTLDTAADFTGYLRAKESLFSREAPVGVMGEEDLLALYLTSAEHISGRCFDVPEDAAVVITEGDWDVFSKSPQRESQLKANERSYLWDQMIDRMAERMTASEYPFGERPEASALEASLRVMAAESRTSRRMLVHHIDHVVGKSFGRQGSAIRSAFTGANGRICYVFLAQHNPLTENGPDGRERREFQAKEYVWALKSMNPNVQRVVAISVTCFPGMVEEAFSYFDLNVWTPDDQLIGSLIREKRGFLKKIYSSAVQQTDYPIPLPTRGGSRFREVTEEDLAE